MTKVPVLSDNGVTSGQRAQTRETTTNEDESEVLRAAT